MDFKNSDMVMRVIRVMGRQSSLLSNCYVRLNTWNKILLIGTLMLGVAVPSGHTLSLASGSTKRSLNDTEVKTPGELPPARTNSRFLRNFPPYDFLNYARRNGIGDSSAKRAFVNGNSPVFYIRLPPAPYVLVPGLGYVSPHPYQMNSPFASPNSPFGSPNSVMMLSPGGGDSGSSASKEQSLNNNVISLPLKFLSNGRPAQIDSPAKKPLPPKKTSTISDSKSTTSLLAGGKYSFNGRPNGVFIVRSPVMGPAAPVFKISPYMH